MTLDTISVVRRLGQTARWRRAEFALEGSPWEDWRAPDLVVCRVRTEQRVAVQSARNRVT